jgi:hypothetical protein
VHNNPELSFRFIQARRAGSRIQFLPQLLTKFNLSSSLLRTNSLVLDSHGDRIHNWVLSLHVHVSFLTPVHLVLDVSFGIDIMFFAPLAVTLCQSFRTLLARY